jgi:hypothetical protein
MISINTACGAFLIYVNSGNGGKDVKKLQSKSDDKNAIQFFVYIHPFLVSPCIGCFPFFI